MDNEPKRNVKDSVFTNLFSDKKYVVQLYEALFPDEEKICEDDITILTLENILINSMYNDLGFLVKDKFVVLVEAQSTWTVNILIRILMYLASTYKDYVIKGKMDLYGVKKAKLPKPELFVIYTGDKIIDKKEISLAEEFFDGEKILDLRAKVVTDGQNNDIVYQYVAFTKVVNEQIKRYGRTKHAIMETIRICKNEDILKDYLLNCETEVFDMMCTLFDKDTYMQIHYDSVYNEGEKNGINKGLIKGREEGKEEGKAELIEELKAAGIDVAEILKNRAVDTKKPVS